MLKNKINVGQNIIVEKKDSEDYVVQNLQISIENYKNSKAFENIVEIEKLDKSYLEKLHGIG